MTYPLARLVDAPDPAAAVRYDFNDAGADAERRIETFTLGAPTLEGDPDAVGVTFGFRSPRLTQRIKGNKQDALLALSALSRQMLRRTNWLMFQLDAVTPPVWLKTYRTGYESLSLEQVYVDTSTGDPVPLPDTWRIEVPFLAEAFGFGERVDIDPVTVTQSPTGDHPMEVVLPAIKGDAPTLLRVSITPETDAISNQLSQWLVGCITGTPELTTGLIRVEDLFAVTETGAVITGAGYFNNKHRATTFVSGINSFQPQLGGALPDLPRGTYKMQLRCQADGVTDIDKTYLFRVLFLDGQDGSSDGPFSQPVTLTIPGAVTANLFRGWIDLGQISVPFGMGGTFPDDVALTAPPVNFAIHMAADDGTGEVRTDALRLIPVDGPTVSAATLLSSELGIRAFAGDETGTWDGDAEVFWKTADGALAPNPVSMAGAFPFADPACERNLLIITALSKGVGFFAVDDHITAPGAAAVVNVSYYPRLLHLPGEA